MKKGHPPPRHYVSCILEFDYHFCLPFLLVSMVVIWCSSWVPPNAFYQNFQRLFFRECYQIWKCISELSLKQHTRVRQAVQWWPVSLSPTSFTTFGGKVPTFICCIYTYIFLEKKLFEKIVVEMVKLVEVPSYHTNSLTTFTDSHEFLLLWEKHEGTVSQYTGIHLPKSIHPYTTEYLSCLYQKMLDWFNGPCIHPSQSKDAWTWACLILDCQWRSYLKLLWISPTFVFE
jgi:hypothetical protein